MIIGSKIIYISYLSSKIFIEYVDKIVENLNRLKRIFIDTGFTYESVHIYILVKHVNEIKTYVSKFIDTVEGIFDKYRPLAPEDVEGLKEYEYKMAEGSIAITKVEDVETFIDFIYWFNKSLRYVVYSLADRCLDIIDRLYLMYERRKRKKAKEEVFEKIRLYEDDLRELYRYFSKKDIDVQYILYDIYEIYRLKDKVVREVIKMKAFG